MFREFGVRCEKSCVFLIGFLLYVNVNEYLLEPAEFSCPVSIYLGWGKKAQSCQYISN